MSKRIPRGAHYVYFDTFNKCCDYLRVEDDKVLKWDGFSFADSIFDVEHICEENDFIRLGHKYA